MWGPAKEARKAFHNPALVYDDHGLELKMCSDHDLKDQ
jgi:hypothetical protein